MVLRILLAVFGYGAVVAVSSLYMFIRHITDVVYQFKQGNDIAYDLLPGRLYTKFLRIIFLELAITFLQLSANLLKGQWDRLKTLADCMGLQTKHIQRFAEVGDCVANVVAVWMS